jgi:Ca-activated chloride channel homolog
MSRTGLVLLIAALLISPIIAAQLKVDVALINVVATVTDETGHYVSDLTADDFIVDEDGQNQTIAHFSQSNDLPVSMGVVLDTSGSMERKIGTATNAVERFIRTVHRDDDIFLMTFSNRPQLIQDFTDDRDKLARALRRVTVGGGTALYDALELSLRKIKSGIQEKKAILLLTDGEDTSSETTFEETLSWIRESELLVYALGISPSGGPLTERSPYPGGTGIPGGTGPGGTTGPNGRRGPTTGGGIGIPFPIPLPIPGTPGGGTTRGPRRFPALPLAPQGRTRVQINQDTVDMTVLDAFADASGGKAWLLSGGWTDNKGREIEAALDQIAAELRNQYSIGYYPPHDLKDGKWHRIQIRTKNKHYLVRSRKDYFGK